MIDHRLLTPAWLTSEIGATTFARASRYARAGRAATDEVAKASRDGIQLTGTCQGSAREPYHQHVLISSHGRGPPSLGGVCDCPVGFNCKHVGALVLTWLTHVAATDAPADPVSAWLAELETESDPRASRSQETLLYLLHPEPAPDSAVAVALAVARQRQDGTWSSGRTAQLHSMQVRYNKSSYLRAVDREILDLLEVVGRSQWSSRTRLVGTTGLIALDRMVSTGRVFLGRDRRGPLRLGPARSLTVSWVPSDAGYQPTLQVDGRDGQLPQLLTELSPPAYLDQDTLEAGRLTLPARMTGEQLRWLLRAPVIEAARAEEVSRRLALTAPDVPRPVSVTVRERHAPPQPCVAVTLDPSAPAGGRARLRLRYGEEGELEVAPSDTRTTLVVEKASSIMRVFRDADAEEQARQRLLASGLDAAGEDAFAVAIEPPSSASALPAAARHAWLDWWQSEVPALEGEGWLIGQEGAGTFALRKASGIAGEVADDAGGWFSLRFDLEVAGDRVPMLPLVSQLIEHYSPGQLPETLYLDVGGNTFVSVPSATLGPVLETILELYSRDRDDGETFRLTRADAPRVLDFEGLPIRGATGLRRLARKLTDWSGLRRVRAPTTFKGTLRPYQQQGLDWLQFLREYGFHGVLADDMGLGKTVQTLAHLAVERRAGRMDVPSLIVAPTSLMGNWRREAAQFTPKLKVLVLHGPEREKWFGRLAEFDVVLTTYPLLPRDHTYLLAQRWHYVILDEAQHVKNPKAQAAQVVRRLDCRHRLCLTGTPVENRLRELWAQFDFLMPGFLGDARHFARRYATPIEKHGDEQRMTSLTQRIRPFLLRRTKERVASELPPKSEVLRSATLGAAQARLYESIRLTMEQRVRQAIAARGLARSHIVVLDALLKLRQVCCDPRLLPPGTSGARRAGSAKFDLLFDLLPELLEEGRRVLLFSQFTTMLGLIEDEVTSRGIVYSKLTGQTRRRDEAIDRFRSGDADVFLISLKAGGVGLNLVEADTVIHYDPWWNPAVEHQATDRAHRIGQHRPVFVYKLIAEGTVEEKILALQQRKQALADAAYGETRGQDQPPIDEETIRALLGAE